MVCKALALRKGAMSEELAADFAALDKAIREIERRTGLSRNTIRRYLRAGAVEPKFKVPERPSKLDPFAGKLSGWLLTEAGKSRKQRRTAKQMHADLALGYGSYGRVAAFVRAWKADQRVMLKSVAAAHSCHWFCAG
jgi:hypothetical protein